VNSIRHRASGFLLVEAAVLVAGVGLLAAAYFSHVTNEQIAQAKRYARSSAERAADAVHVFAFLNGRLPRPASAGGNEGPAGIRAGGVPVAALGLPLVPSKDMTYRLADPAAAVAGSLDVAVIDAVGIDKSMRFEQRPLRTTGSSVNSAGYLQHSFCETLRGLGSGSAEVYAVSATTRSSAVPEQINVAPASMWGSFGCAAQRETVLRSHRNLLAQTRYLLRSYQDWNELKRIEEVLHFSNVLRGGVHLAKDINGIARQGAKVLGNAASDMCALCPDATGAGAAYAAGLTPINGAKVALASLNLSRAVAMQVLYGQDLVEFDRVETQLKDLVVGMGRRVTNLTDHGRANNHRFSKR
jgi:hypothetical protein